MPKKIDLIGQRFGRLTVISKLPPNGGPSLWQCLCDCGNSKVAAANVLQRGDCKSCGCLHQEYLASRHAKTDIDLSGKRFGKLIALHKVKIEGKKSIMWLCQCDCGKQVPVAASELKHNHVRSCGCLVSDHVSSFFDEGTNVAALLANTVSSRNKSGTKGVFYDASRNKWSAEIMFQGKRYRLGRRSDKKDAIRLREEAEEKLHGDFLAWYKAKKDPASD
ncbi:hypothetical protein JJQ72_06345 [Paenibacillus sp. F411]|uniref:AP2 domain-containing protein n=1 Tax=Paenibacillus sp. F411 TaxID=2820239 RepID=UPI001AAF6F6E|nr:AP2 domain-containing protein [Paenibacillus sp. F411]MBO2943597.1 hypothetical protein [Paenibacillus sp. F411]